MINSLLLKTIISGEREEYFLIRKKIKTMIKTNPFRESAIAYDAWYDKYPFVFQSEVAAIRQQMNNLSENISGIEVGLGTGRFASALGIKEGIEPIDEMAAFATKRGVEIIKGVAENLPYRDLHFDFMLYVTICYLDNLPLALKEAHRVLKNKGSIIIGFLDKDQTIARSYEAKRKNSHFYQNARFYTVDQVKTLLENVGFRNLDFTQTLFGDLDDIQELQSPKAGFGEGSFVVVRAEKKA